MPRRSRPTRCLISELLNRLVPPPCKPSSSQTRDPWGGCHPIVTSLGALAQPCPQHCHPGPPGARASVGSGWGLRVGEGEGAGQAAPFTCVSSAKQGSSSRQLSVTKGTVGTGEMPPPPPPGFALGYTNPRGTRVNVWSLVLREAMQATVAQAWTNQGCGVLLASCPRAQAAVQSPAPSGRRALVPAVETLATGRWWLLVLGSWSLRVRVAGPHLPPRSRPPRRKEAPPS